jgi:hypothetical protein
MLLSVDVLNLACLVVGATNCVLIAVTNQLPLGAFQEVFEIQCRIAVFVVLLYAVIASIS